MSRQLNLLVTVVTTLLALLLALQLKDPDSVLMRLLYKPRSTLHFQSARRAFTSHKSFPSTPIVNMATNMQAAQPSASNNHPTKVPSEGEDVPLRDSEGRLLGLPEPPSGEEATKLDMSGGGDSVKLDHLGPMVVNKDGTLSRIENWDKMTEQEKKTTLRVLGKRNKERTSALKEAEDSAAGEKAE